MHRSIQLRLILMVLCAIAFGSCNQPSPANPSISKVGIFLFAQHPIINDIYNGFKAELNRQAAQQSVQVQYIERNADGDMAQAAAIAGFFKAQTLDAIFVVGVPAAQVLKSTGIQTPVVLGGPPDVVAAGLAPRLANHGTNFTGTQYLPPVDEILEVFRLSFPGRSKIAVLHNPGESNSMAVVTRFLARAKTRNFEIDDFGVSNAPEIEAALRSISVSKPDGVFLPTDNLVYSNLDRILTRTQEMGVAVFNCTKLAVEKGAIFSLATDYEQVGKLSASVAGQVIFSKVPPQDIDILDIRQGSIYIKQGSPISGKVRSIPGYDIVTVP